MMTYISKHFDSDFESSSVTGMNKILMTNTVSVLVLGK